MSIRAPARPTPDSGKEMRHITRRTRMTMACLTFAALHAQALAAQSSGVDLSFYGTSGFRSYVASGGGAEAYWNGWTDQALHTMSQVIYNPGAPYSAHSLSGQARMGLLTGATYASAGLPPWGGDQLAGSRTTMDFFDQLTVTSPGQLVFRMALADGLSIASNATVSQRCSVQSFGLTGGGIARTCALAAARMQVLSPVGGPYLYLEDTTAPYGPEDTQVPTTTIAVNIGDVFRVRGTLEVGVGACVWEPSQYTDCVDNSNPANTSTSTAWGTAQFFVSGTGGATYTSASGQDYSLTTTPEPGSVALLATGFGLFAVIRRKRRTSRA